MRRDQFEREDEEAVSYWKSAVDILSALVLVILLCLVVLILNVLPEDGDQPYTETGIAENLYPYEEGFEFPPYAIDPNRTFEPSYINIVNINDNANGGNGGDGGGGQNQWASPSPSRSPYPSTSPFGGIDEFTKAAVFVTMIDADTKIPIEEAGIGFELFRDDNSRVVMNSYYPVRMDYDLFETTEDGEFYFPEKITLGDYYLKELTAPQGYEKSGDVEFSIDRAYDWSNPYIVYVPFSASRNSIRVQVSDAKTGIGLSGVSFTVIAKSNIVTADGTIRYARNEEVTTINCNDEGFGESSALFLGEYMLRQDSIPEGYAACSQDNIDAIVSKGDSKTTINQLTCEKTNITVVLTDELERNLTLADAEFELYGAGADVREFVTDNHGTFKTDGLQKDTLYYVRQTKANHDYRFDDQAVSFRVDAQGYIDGEVKKTISVTNRLIRAEFSLVDLMMRRTIVGKEARLLTESGNVVTTWQTTSNAYAVNGLNPGRYELILSDQPDNRHEVVIEDKANIQRIEISLVTNESMMMIAIAIGVAGLLIIVIILVLILRARKKRKAKRMAEEKADASTAAGGDETRDGTQ